MVLIVAYGLTHVAKISKLTPSFKIMLIVIIVIKNVRSTVLKVSKIFLSKSVRRRDTAIFRAVSQKPPIISFEPHGQKSAFWHEKKSGRAFNHLN